MKWLENSFRYWIRPVQVPRWQFDFEPWFKTKFKELGGKNIKNFQLLKGPVVFPLGSYAKNSEYLPKSFPLPVMFEKADIL